MAPAGHHQIYLLLMLWNCCLVWSALPDSSSSTIIGKPEVDNGADTAVTPAEAREALFSRGYDGSDYQQFSASSAYDRPYNNDPYYYNRVGNRIDYNRYDYNRYEQQSPYRYDSTQYPSRYETNQMRYGNQDNRYNYYGNRYNAGDSWNNRYNTADSWNYNNRGYKGDSWYNRYSGIDWNRGYGNGYSNVGDTWNRYYNYNRGNQDYQGTWISRPTSGGYHGGGYRYEDRYRYQG